MGLITKKGSEIKEDLGITKEAIRGKKIVEDITKHFDEYHAKNEIYDNDIVRGILEDELKNIENPKKLNFGRGLVTFSPSSADKCERELYYKAKKYPKDEQVMYPYQRRWVRNGSAVHEAVQKDLLFAEKYNENPLFKVARMKKPAEVAGRPAWEHNLKTVKQFPELGFQVFGMMDGVLEYTPDGSKLGFEFKTKSTTIASIGEYKLKDIQSSHRAQITAYSILFGLDEFIVMYESVAKDWWGKGEEARPDLRPFYAKVTDEEKYTMMAKFKKVAGMVKNNELPPAEFPEDRKEYETNFKCIFCPYKSVCEKDKGFSQEQIDAWDKEKEDERKAKAEARKKKQKGAK